jgi:hypothetical protein
MARSTASLALIVGLFCITGCSMTQTIPESESPSAKLYVQTCTQCHGLPAPQRHTAEQWDHLLVMMQSFMEQRELAFPEDEKKLIREYLHKNAR